jgi:tetratricopeptide (TPR) repeat protein
MSCGPRGRHGFRAPERAGQLNERVRREALTRLLDHYLDAAAGAVRLAFPGQARAGVPDLAATRFGSAGEAMAWLDAERPNLLALARSTVDSSAGHTVQLSTTVAPYLDACAHHQDALTLHTLAVAAARATGDRTGEGRSASLLATLHRRLGEYHRALDSYAYAFAIHREVGDRAGEGTTRHAIELTCWRVGRYGEAFEHITEALAIYRETGDRAGEGSVLYGLGLVQLQLGRYDDALAQHERALASTARSGTGSARVGPATTWATSTSGSGATPRRAGSTSARWRSRARSATVSGRRSPSSTSRTSIRNWAATTTRGAATNRLWRCACRSATGLVMPTPCVVSAWCPPGWASATRRSST